MPIAVPLTQWYDKNARDLPWRRTHDAYHIWVSEIMLQQTRVHAAIPYYLRFIAALPDIAALAHVDEEALFKLWEGLGYYSRARNLQRAAQLVLNKHNGCLPADLPSLLALPGIGPYTAGAIASIAYGVPTPAVDGNVLRVLARLCCCKLDPSKPATRDMAASALLAMLPPDHPGKFNQALMELGATVCLPNSAPLCCRCPLAGFCAAKQTGTTADFPIKPAKAKREIEKHTVFVLRRGGAIALRKRACSGLLAGLWELPNAAGWLDEADAFHLLRYEWDLQHAGEILRYEAKHIFTHKEWHMRVYNMQIVTPELPACWAWDKGERALPSAFRICLKSAASVD